jgi:pyruvate dehydrogenase E2 component (dihydrolipoamide acetyltransferase)
VSQSWREIPHFAVEREIDATEAQAALAALRLREPAATHTDLLLRALAVALGQTVGGSGDLGLAVATPDGVLMPVVAGVSDLSASQLVAARRAAVQRARDGRLNGADVTSRPLASLSNLGSRGVDAFTGIIAVGQQLLLTVGAIRPRPVVLDGGLHVRPTFTATLNVDHRSFDGDRAANVLAAFDRDFGTIRAWVEGAHT